MRRRALLGVVVYTVLLALYALPQYGDALFGREWLILVTVGAGTLGMAAAVARWWALPVAAAALFVLVLSADPEGLDYLALIVGMPVVLALASVGWLAGRLLGAAAAVLLLLVAAMPAGIAAVELARRGDRVPAAVQAQLPLRLSLSGLCPGEDPAGQRALRRQTERLIAELHRRPRDVVPYTAYYEDAADETYTITLRQLAEDQLSDLNGCAPDLRRRLRAALG